MKIITVLVGLLTITNCMAQTTARKGKIIYEELTGKNAGQIEMWFDNSNYVYFREVQDKSPRASYKNVQDSLMNVEKEESKRMFFASRVPQTWFGSLTTNTVTNSVYINKKFYCVIDTMDFVKWEILDDTVTTDGILCQKAIGLTSRGNKINALFAPSIPVSVAPFTLRGLPGLLISAKQDANSVSLRMLRLDWPSKDDPTIAIPNNCFVVSKENRNAVAEEANKELLKLAEFYKNELEGKKKKN